MALKLGKTEGKLRTELGNKNRSVFEERCLKFEKIPGNLFRFQQGTLYM